MKSRVATVIVIATCFVGLFLTQHSATYLLIGSWRAGVTELYWQAYIVLALASCFVSCFYPGLRNVLLLLVAPLLATLICKALSVSFVLLFHHLSIEPIVRSVSGLLLAYLFFLLYWQLGAKKSQAIFLAAILTVALGPVAYEFTQQMLEHTVTPADEAAAFRLPVETSATRDNV